ncbi:short-chain dehydrogenase [Pochonia chlamydosporia 170]|uniref:Short-chain dehydrogenase n=1 Tax=Pochonia chlamydosporia 170 TaxID=1380566 RepID=A0A179FS53_METCM|nr:short-chain dehydrogenase [Pochonia chlamydosporia 170]OAQ68030.1 short-chain dehydrogenase [Pochonia chlamydosporia 170]
MGQSLSSIRPPKPRLTEENLPDQTGKVFLITGASGGVGKELASMVYKHNAKVYIAARSEDKSTAAIASIKQQYPKSKGQLIFLHLDLGDLTTIPKSAEQFLRQESRLDVLWLNAGVMVPPAGSKTTQGYELQLGTNNIGHFLFTKLLHPILKSTAASAPRNSVRVIWVSSSAIDVAPSGVIDFTNMDYKRDERAWTKYGRSKAGNVLHAVEFARRTESEGIVSVSLNPGNLATDLQRSMPGWQAYVWAKLLAYPAKFGAYTELFAGLHPDVKLETSGMFIAPWGRIVKARKDLFDPALGRRYWEWTEEQVKPYV